MSPIIIKPKPGVMINPLHQLSKELIWFWLFNEGTGNIAHDISNTHTHGSLRNMSQNSYDSGWTGSEFGGGLKYDGINDYVLFGTNEIFNDESISLWFKSTAANNDTRLFDANYIGIYVNNTGGGGSGDSLQGTVHDGSAFRAVEWPWTNINDNTWYHVVFTYGKDGNVKLYVNGDLKDTNATYNGTVGSTSEIQVLGSKRDGSSDFFNGFIDIVSIYNRILTAYEVKELYINPFCNLSTVPIGRLYVPPISGWTGIINGITNPAYINGVAVANIASVNGVS